LSDPSLARGLVLAGIAPDERGERLPADLDAGVSAVEVSLA
jgi:hypothetical protein